ncbi:MAG: hypothetical protein NUV40_01685 [Patescibacteria group bacterium]|nr:hypothetical protein [Patescibacteria group bacterium]
MPGRALFRLVGSVGPIEPFLKFCLSFWRSRATQRIKKRLSFVLARTLEYSGDPFEIFLAFKVRTKGVFDPTTSRLL